MFKNAVWGYAARNLLIVVDASGTIQGRVAERSSIIQKGETGNGTSPRDLRVAIDEEWSSSSNSGVIEGSKITRLVLEAVFAPLSVAIAAGNLVIIVYSKNVRISCAGVTA